MWRYVSIGTSHGKRWSKPFACSLDWIFVFIVTYSLLSILFYLSRRLELVYSSSSSFVKWPSILRNSCPPRIQQSFERLTRSRRATVTHGITVDSNLPTKCWSFWLVIRTSTKQRRHSMSVSAVSPIRKMHRALRIFSNICCLWAVTK